MIDFGALSPHLPTSPTDWFHVVAIALAGSVKVFRGSVMHERARRIDFFGWSIILFDYVFGGVLLIGTLWVFYPGLRTEAFDLLITAALATVALWQGYTVWRAPVHRIDRAISNPDDVPPDGDRRVATEPRRQVDKDDRAELEMYRALHREHMDGVTS